MEKLPLLLRGRLGTLNIVSVFGEGFNQKKPVGKEGTPYRKQI